MSTQSENVAFFASHAGWSYRPIEENPEQAKRRNGYKLAAAEAWADNVGLEFSWEDDWEVDHVAEFDCYDEPPTSCEVCIVSRDGDVVASLGCIDDADDDYRRVIMAELASEAMWHAVAA